MENNYIKLNLTKEEIELLQLVLAEYIVAKKVNRLASENVNNAKILLDNINFYKRQQKEE